MQIGRLTQKCAAVGLLTAAIAVVYGFVAAPLERRLVTAVERIGAERDLLARLQRSLAAATPADPRSDETPDRSPFLAGESEAVMAARLEAILGALTKAAVGVRTTSTRTVTSRDHMGLRLIGLEARMTAPLAGLQRLLLELDRMTPTVLVDGLQVGPAASAGTAEAGGDGLLEVRIEIFGAARRFETPALVREAAALAGGQAEPKPLGGDDARRR